MTALAEESVLEGQSEDAGGGVKEPEPAQVEAEAKATATEEEPITDAQDVEDVQSDEGAEGSGVTPSPSDDEVAAKEAAPASEGEEAMPTASEELPVETASAEEETVATTAASDVKEPEPAREEATATPVATKEKPAAKKSKAKKKTTKKRVTKKKAAPAAAEEEPVAAAAKVPTEDKLFRKGRDWYVVHTYSGYEDKVCTNLEHRIKSMDAENLVFRVIVPTVEEMEIRDGQRKAVPRKIFPGYVLVEMITLQQEDAKASAEDMARSNKAWMVVRNSPGVTGFVGLGTHPTPLEHEEVQSIMKQMRAEEPVVKVGFTIGQSVRVSDGPFADFVGTVEEINPEKGKVKVLVSFFGRETPVELDFLQVERL